MILKFIKYVFAAILSFERPSTLQQNIKCISLNKASCLARPALIDSNPNESSKFLGYPAP